ncbi:MAG TPA: TOBE domain-containing protein, partial [Aggregatilineales bacterium]|nr:TOBE domain-containing protein [Aggregatilineales bacterium]
LMFRPEDVEISQTHQNGKTIGEGLLESLAFAGNHQRAVIRLNSPANTRITALIPNSTDAPAEKSSVYIEVNDYHLLQVPGRAAVKSG